MSARIQRFFDSGLIQTIIGVFGGLAGTFLDGRLYVVMAGMVPFALEGKNVLEGLRTRWKITVHVVLALIAASIFFFFGRKLNQSRPGTLSPKDYAAEVKKVLPIAAAPIVNTIVQPTRVITEKASSPPRVAITGPLWMQPEGQGALYNFRLENMGGNIAKREVSATGYRFGPKSRTTEDQLFQHISNRVKEERKIDQEIGSEHRVRRGLHVNPTADESVSYSTGAAVLYMGITVVYEELGGKKHRSEVCVYQSRETSTQLPELCLTHNMTN